MTLQDTVHAAIMSRPHGQPAGVAALDAVAEHVAADDNTAHEVATSVSLRQAANETPASYVKRIVAAYLTEAVTPACVR